MKTFLNRFSTSDKITILLKILAVGTLALLMSSCASLDFRIGTLNYAAQRQALNVSNPIEVKTFTSNFDTFKNLDPQDLGLSFGGNWIHCRTHGFHDLNNWTDFTYNPYWCRPSDGFMRASLYNWNWGGYNYWNPRFNYLGYTPHRWSPFGYDRWGYNNWMGNVYYGNRWNNYYGWNNNYIPYHLRRSNINGRRGNVSPRTRSTRVIRTTPTRTRTIPNNVRPTRTIRPTRTTPNTVRPVRTRITPNTVRPTRTTPNTVRPVRTQPVRINSPRINAPSRTSGNTNVIRGSKPTNVKKDNLK